MVLCAREAGYGRAGREHGEKKKKKSIEPRGNAIGTKFDVFSVPYEESDYEQEAREVE